MIKYNMYMIVLAKEQIRSLLALKGLTQKKLAELITLKTGKNCSQNSLSKKLTRGTITYNEVMQIADLLEFDVNYISRI